MEHENDRQTSSQMRSQHEEPDRFRDDTLSESSSRDLQLTRCGKHKLNFKQQTIPAWEPVLAPRFVICSLFASAVFLVLVGSIMVGYNSTVVQCIADYEGPSDPMFPMDSELIITEDNCTGLHNSSTLRSNELFLYYSLDGFYQNHRRYIKSVHFEQLEGHVYTSRSSLEACDPETVTSGGRILSPCGLMARSLFNDTYVMYQRADTMNPSLSPGNLVKVDLDESAEAIVVDKDFTSSFRNPDLTPEQSYQVYEWIDPSIFPGRVENPHFRVWMKLATLPSFSKLYGKVQAKDKLTLPLVLKIKNRYPSTRIKAKKGIVLSSVTWDGTQSTLLSAMYIALGCFCGFIGFLFFNRNRKNPRILGDLRYLNWTQS